MKEISIFCGGLCRCIPVEVPIELPDHPLPPAEWMIRLLPYGAAAAAAGWRAMLCAFRQELHQPRAAKQLIAQPAEIAFSTARSLTEAALREEELARILMEDLPAAQKEALRMMRFCFENGWMQQLYYFLSLAAPERRRNLAALAAAPRPPAKERPPLPPMARPPCTRLDPQVVQTILDREKQRICLSPPAMGPWIFLDLFLLRRGGGEAGPVLPLLDEAGQPMAEVSVGRLPDVLQPSVKNLLRRQKTLALSVHPSLSIPAQKWLVVYLWMKIC